MFNRQVIRLGFVCLLVTFFTVTYSQNFKTQEKYIIKYRESKIKLFPILWLPFYKVKYKNSKYDNRYYLLFQFHDLPEENKKEFLDNKGVRILYYLHSYTYLVSIPEKNLTRKLKRLNFRSIRPIPIKNKLSPLLKQLPYPEWIVRDKQMIEVNVEFYPDIDNHKLKAELKKEGIREYYFLQSYNKFRVKIPSASLPDLIKLPWVMWVEPIEPPLWKKN